MFLWAWNEHDSTSDHARKIQMRRVMGGAVQAASGPDDHGLYRK